MAEGSVQTPEAKRSWIEGVSPVKASQAFEARRCPDCEHRGRGACSALGERIIQASRGCHVGSTRSSLQTIPARRTICHQKESLENIPMICRGWASTSIVLSDGRRQILSFLLPGDFAASRALFEPFW